MQEMYKYILESTSEGKLSQETAVHMLKLLQQKEIKPDEEIAIIGISLQTPLANSTAEFWEQLKAGEDCIRPFPMERRKDTDSYLDYLGDAKVQRDYCECGFLTEIDKFDPAFFRISPKEAALMDPNQRLFLETAWLAIEDAGYGGNKLAGSRTGVYVGYYGEGNHYEKYIESIDSTLLDLSKVGNMTPIISSRISYLLDLRGPNMLVNTACSSSLVAVHLACQAIRNGECETAIAGSVKINLLPILNNSADIGITSSDWKTKAFDDVSDGTGLGEGSIAIVLKPLKQALKDKDSIYAVIKGSAVNQDGSSIGITAPNVTAQEDVIVRAWKAAKVDPETISYIEAHGTGTKLGDPVEVEGMQRAFRRFTDKKGFCAIGSVKTNLGHLDHCAGLAGLVKAVLALKNKQIPASLHFKKPNRQINFIDSALYLNNQLTDWESSLSPRRCGVSSFGLSGTNCHLVLEEFSAQSEEGFKRNDCPNLVTFSAKTSVSLSRMIANYSLFLDQEPQLDISDICYTANTGRGHYNHRIAFVVHNYKDLQNQLKMLAQTSTFETLVEGVYYGESSRSYEKTLVEQKEVTSKVASIIQKLNMTNKEHDLEDFDDLCRLYVGGAEINWSEIYQGEVRNRVNLPTYAFARERCWLEPQITQEKELYFTTNWKRENCTQGVYLETRGHVLIFKDQDQLGSRLATQLRLAEYDVTEVEFGYDEAELHRLLEEIEFKSISKVIHMSTLGYDSEEQTFMQLEANLQMGVYSLFRITQNLLQHLTHPIQLVIVSSYVHDVTQTEKTICTENAALLGFAKVVHQEYEHVQCKFIDVDDEIHVDSLFKEIHGLAKTEVVAYRRNVRYIEEFAQLDVSQFSDDSISLRENGIYIVTGGLGGIGLEVGKYLISQKKVTLVLINRTKLPPSERWDEIIHDDVEGELCRKLIAIRELETLGAKVVCYGVDVASFEEMDLVLKDIRDQHGAIHGLFHCAGIPSHGFIMNEDLRTLSDVLSTKVHGTRVLDQLTTDDALDFLVLFSSAVTLTGALGQSGYTAANNYLDAYGVLRNKKGLKTVTINWTAWQETGMAFKHGLNEKGFFHSLTTNEAVVAMDFILRKSIPRVLVGRIRMQEHLRETLNLLPIQISHELLTKIEQKSSTRQRTSEVGVGEKQIRVRLIGRNNETFTAIEKQVAQIWGEVLGYEEIHITHHFYDIGGDSIIAMKIVHGMNAIWPAKISIPDILKFSTIEALSHQLEQKLNSLIALNRPIITEQPTRDYYPVSAAQKRLLILHALDEEATNYNMPVVMSIEGKLDQVLVECALQALIRQQESLRTSFGLEQGEFVQYVHKQVDFQMEYLQTTELLADERVKQFIRPFDVKHAPLFRVSMIHVGEHKHLLLFDMHHVISDGMSMNIVIKEFAQAYQGQELPQLNIQYKDYAVWHNHLLLSDSMKEHEAYWLRNFADELPVLDLPTDYPRPVIKSFQGDRLLLTIDQQLTRTLNQLAQATGSTLYMVLLTAFNVLLYRWSGQEDIVVGTPVSGRQHADIDGIIGMFVNTLAMRNYPVGGKSFIQFVQEVKERSLLAYEYQDYPFEELVEKLNVRRDTSRNPLFDVMFVMQNGIINDVEWDHVVFSPYPLHNPNAKFDLTLEVKETKDQLVFTFEYAVHLFDQTTIERMAMHFETLLRDIVRNPQSTLAALSILPDEEKVKILVDFNATTCDYSVNMTLCELFEDQVQRTPYATALLCEEEVLTYSELNIKVNQLARYLQSQGVKRGSIVAIMVDRSQEMLVGIMAILKAGGAYLPIDPQYPTERIRYMFEDSGAGILLTIDADEMSEFIFNGIKVFLDDKSIFQGNHANLEIQSAARDLAYVIYTSGSTGLPKGVMIEHRSVINRIQWMQRMFPLTSNDIILQKTPISFDVSVWELFWWFFAGAKVCLLAPGGEKSPDMLVKFIEQYQITTLHFVPSMLTIFLEWVQTRGNVDKLGSLKWVFASGEALHVQQVKWFYELMNPSHQAQLVNLYGPTEATVDVTYFPCHALGSRNTVPIGYPIQNIQMYILGAHNQLQPLGVPGELCIAGDGVARGYLNKPELTAEKFGMNPLVVNQRIYRTGDRVRWQPDGTIEYLGRLDHQVKIRGFRIELEEIENHLLEHQEVREAVVIPRTSEFSQHQDLCAYIVAHQEDRTVFPDIRLYLTARLPKHMIPTFIVWIPSMPLSPNGKINRKALPEPQNHSSQKLDYMPPRNKLEIQLVELWCSVLGVSKVGLQDNFFNLGGHSLKAAVLISRIYKELHCDVPLREVFRNPTVIDLAAYIQAAQKHVYGGIPTIAPQEYYPVSAAQKRMLVLHAWEGDSTSYNMPVVFHLAGHLNTNDVERALLGLIERHQILRTSFKQIDGEFVQYVHEQISFQMQLIQSTQEQADEWVKRFIRPFDVSQAPLLRVSLVRLTEQEHLLMIDMHHVISDGVSMNILVEEFTRLYRGEELTKLSIEYKDYTVWHNALMQAETMKEHENYWLNELKDEPSVLDLPFDYPRPAIQSFEGDRLIVSVDLQLMQGLNKLVRETDTTLYMVLMAALNVLLYRWSGQEDILIGSPVAGRQHADIEGVLGLFINTLTIRNYPKGDQTFLSFLFEVKERALSAYEHQEYPFEQLVEKLNVRRDTSRNPLFDVMLDLVHANKVMVLQDDLVLSDYPLHNNISKFDLSLNAIVDEMGIQIIFEYSTKLFSRETIERMSTHYKNILLSICANPEVSLDTLEMLDVHEKLRLIAGNRENEMEHPEDKRIHEWFEAQVERTPDQVSVVFNDQQLTYKELNEQANQLARVLQYNGVKAGSIVGVLSERSLEMVVGVFAILKAGGAYLPIDPQYPQDRIQYMIEQSKIQLLLTQSAFIGRTEFQGTLLCLDDVFTSEWEHTNLGRTCDSNNLAYVIYTSGTTGKPKGVMISHQNYIAIAYAWEKEYRLGDFEVRLLQMASFSFDVFSGDLARMIIGGGTLILCPEETKTDLIALYELIQKHRITLVEATPSLLIPLMDYIYENQLDISFLHILIMGSDTCSGKDFRRLTERYGSIIRIINSYGVTEATIDSSFYEGFLDPDLHYVPIGKPLPNVKYYVLGNQLQLRPEGAKGELYIAGCGVGHGYIHNPELTASRFVPNPFSPGEFMYKTGDSVRWLPDGNMIFMGRMDYQVKIRGYRIELGEIESSLLRYPELKEVVVLVKEDQNENKSLYAYFTADLTISISELKTYLRNELPHYMVPTYFVQMERFALTPNGKLDKNALPDPIAVQHTDSNETPLSNVEMILSEVYQEIMGIHFVGIHDNFFELGGDSIKAIQISAKLLRHNLRLDIRKLFQYPTISELSRHITPLDRQIDQSLVEGEVSLTPIQRWFFQQKFENQHHWNQSIMLHHKSGFNPQYVEEVFKRLGLHHDALRMVYRMNGKDVVQYNRGKTDNLYHLQIFDLRQDGDVGAAIQTIAQQVQESIDLSAGPLVKLALFHTLDGDHLLIVVHHLAVDGVSWRIILEDFALGYAQVSRNVPIELPSKTDSFLVWSKQLQIYANSKQIQKQRNYWEQVGKWKVPDLPKDAEVHPKKVKDRQIATFSLSVENTELLLKKVHSAYLTKIQEILILALGMAIKSWSGNEKIIISLEGHGREPLFDNLDISRTIGWFTCEYPVLLELKSDHSSDLIKEVKEQLRHIPDHGVGYGILKYLSESDHELTLPRTSHPEISFNYLGQFDQAAELDDIEIGMSSYSMGMPLSSDSIQIFTFEFNSWIDRDQLKMECFYNKHEYAEHTILSIINSFQKYLEDLIDFCNRQEETEWTPIDYGDDELTMEELNEITSLMNKISN